MANMTVQQTQMTPQERAREEARQRSGRFGAQIHSAPEAALGGGGTLDALLDGRRAQLAALGFVPAHPKLALTDATDAATWWKRTESIAEGGQYELMPRKGAKLRTYEGHQTQVKMPSVSAIRRHAAAGETFDVPVEAITPHGPITGHVRVTANGNGRYAVSGVQMPPEHAEYVSESVQAALEARRPTRALTEVRDILSRRRERLASAGVRMRPVDSSWVHGIGYNPHDEQLVMDLQGRTYGYHVDRDTYEELMTSHSIGQAYNALVKKTAPKFEVDYHDECNSYFYAGREHRCRSTHNAPKRLASV